MCLLNVAISFALIAQFVLLNSFLDLMSRILMFEIHFESFEFMNAQGNHFWTSARLVGEA